MNSICKNKLIIINELNLKDIEKGSIFIIDGKDIQTETDYLKLMTEKFDLTKFNNQLCNLNGYLDLMTDLSWLDKGWLEPSFEKFDNIFLIIKNYQKAFNGNFNDINYVIINIFVEDILPFWDKNETITRKFNVYLVRNLKE